VNGLAKNADPGSKLPLVATASGLNPDMKRTFILGRPSPSDEQRLRLEHLLELAMDLLGALEVADPPDVRMAGLASWGFHDTVQRHELRYDDVFHKNSFGGCWCDAFGNFVVP
jgi:hypothetical protein